MTENFNISEAFQGPMRGIIEQAVRSSDLVEGVSIVAVDEMEIAIPPFVVLMMTPNHEIAAEALKYGAIECVPYVKNAKRLADLFDQKTW